MVFVYVGSFLVPQTVWIQLSAKRASEIIRKIGQSEWILVTFLEKQVYKCTPRQKTIN